jgi:hypothetical protein
MMIGRRVRTALLALCVLAFARPVETFAAEGCRYLDHDFARQVEWLEGTESRGAKLAIRDARWRWFPLHIGSGIACDGCADIVGDMGALLVGGPLFSTGSSHGPFWKDYDKDHPGLDPRYLTMALQAMTASKVSELKAVTEVRPVSVAGLTGHARVVSTEVDGRSHHAVAFLAEEKCFSLFGLIHSATGKEVSLNDLAGFSSAVAVERYTPIVTPEKLGARTVSQPSTELPLGDARKKAQEGKQ